MRTEGACLHRDERVNIQRQQLNIAVVRILLPKALFIPRSWQDLGIRNEGSRRPRIFNYDFHTWCKITSPLHISRPEVLESRTGNPVSPEPFVFRAKALSTKRSRKGMGTRMSCAVLNCSFMWYHEPYSTSTFS